jgi:hypothetical protein
MQANGTGDRDPNRVRRATTSKEPRTVPTHTPPPPSNGCVETLLAGVERVPAVTLQIDDAHSSAGVRVADRVVARIDLRHGRVLVKAPADVIPRLQRDFPSSRPGADGIIFDLARAHSASEALAAIHRRVTVERLAPQFRVASP